MDSNQKEESLADQKGHLNKKCCVDCKTTKTPLWRSGPAGPKSLCNACGIRYRKKRNAIMGLNKGSVKKKHKSITKNNNDQSQNSRSKKGGNGIVSKKDQRVSEDLRVRLRALGKEVVLLQRERSIRRPRSDRKLGEVEQAAVLLMALSCGSVFA